MRVFSSRLLLSDAWESNLKAILQWVSEREGEKSPVRSAINQRFRSFFLRVQSSLSRDDVKVERPRAPSPLRCCCRTDKSIEERKATTRRKNTTYPRETNFTSQKQATSKPLYAENAPIRDTYYRLPRLQWCRLLWHSMATVILYFASIGSTLQ